MDGTPPPEGPTIRVLLADDHNVLRAGLRAIIEAQPDMTVVGEAADGVEAVAAAHTLRPDVVVMDVNMPRMDGVEATRRLRIEIPLIRVVVLSMHEGTAIAEEVKEAGASAFVPKTGAFEDLSATIRFVARARALPEGRPGSEG